MLFLLLAILSTAFFILPMFSTLILDENDIHYTKEYAQYKILFEGMNFYIIDGEDDVRQTGEKLGILEGLSQELSNLWFIKS